MSMTALIWAPPRAKQTTGYLFSIMPMEYLGTQLGLFCYSDVKAPASALGTTINDMCSVGVIYIAMAQSRVSRTEAHRVFGALG